MASHTAARRAVKFGYKNAFVLGEGIDGWMKAEHPVSKVSVD